MDKPRRPREQLRTLILSPHLYKADKYASQHLYLSPFLRLVGTITTLIPIIGHLMVLMRASIEYAFQCYVFCAICQSVLPAATSYFMNLRVSNVTCNAQSWVLRAQGLPCWQLTPIEIYRWKLGDPLQPITLLLRINHLLTIPDWGEFCESSHHILYAEDIY